VDEGGLFFACDTGDLKGNGGAIYRIGSGKAATITDAKRPAAEPLPGFKEVQPVVFCGMFPTDAADFRLLDGSCFVLFETATGCIALHPYLSAPFWCFALTSNTSGEPPRTAGSTSASPTAPPSRSSPTATRSPPAPHRLG